MTEKSQHPLANTGGLAALQKLYDSGLLLQGGEYGCDMQNSLSKVLSATNAEEFHRAMVVFKKESDNVILILESGTVPPDIVTSLENLSISSSPPPPPPSSPSVKKALK
jgi:hypothetical protein